MGWFKRITARLNAKADRPTGFLGRLRRDQRGATLAMMAAIVIPMIGVVGGAVDMSRAYLVKVRLQQACDAGVLAARRAMTGNSVASDANAIQQATNFFNINLKDGDYGAKVTSIAVSDVNDSAGKPSGTVHGAASATVPTTLMRVFGKQQMAMTASCEATLQVANNDVMFVLDVTGSMNCAATDTSCSNNGGVEAASAKIKAVRTAVVDFYSTLAGATTATAQLRIGIVPYSSNVNVGKLLPANYITDQTYYQSRKRVINSYSSSTSGGTWTTTSTGAWSGYSAGQPQYNVSQSSCTGLGGIDTTYSNNTSTPTSTTAADGTITTTTVYTRTATDTDSSVTWTKTGTTWWGQAFGTCSIQSRTRTRTETKTDVTTQTPATFAWQYDWLPYDTSQFKLGNTVTTYTGDGYVAQNSTWTGCLEERKTLPQATFSTIPAGAYDLHIDDAPTTDPETQWKPWWPELIYDRNSTSAVGPTSTDYGQPSGDSAVCPKQAMKLAVTDKTTVSNYVNAADFKARGGTYHDIGMLWGARLLSPTGIFAAQNATAPNGQPINRSIVFMTDGDMAPQPTIYGLYGYEKIDRRISGSGNVPTSSDLKDRHNSRFSMICSAIKAMNITIYVVAYGQTMTTELQNCATPNQAFYAADDATLKATFQRIAKQIAQLRLSA